MTSNIVLVHGAFHGGWCWRAVMRLLRADGHTVYAPTLTGLGERAHLLGPDIGLATHIDDIVNLVEAEELDRAVLVAHSYGGMPAVGAADRLVAETPGRIEALVLLDSYIPNDGDSALSVRESDPILPPRRPGGDGISVPVPPAEAFGLSGELAAWANRRLTPQPFAAINDKLALTGAWLDIPRKIYIRMTGNPAAHFDRAYEVAAAAATDKASGWAAIRRDGPHNAMMTDPDWFVGVLKACAL